MKHTTIQTAFFLVLFIGIAVIVFLLFKPFIAPLIAAFTLAVLFYPLYQKILTLLRGHKSLASLLTITIVLILVLVPLLFFGFQIFSEGKDFYLNHLVGNQPLRLIPDQVAGLLGPRFGEFQDNVGGYIQQGLIWLLEHVGVIFSSITHLAFMLFITLIALYYLFKQGADFKARLIAFSPLSDHYDRTIIDKLQLAVGSVIKGVLVVAILQAILSGIGFTLFGVPNAALWGCVAMLAALIPGFGTALVMTPAVLYLVLTGHVWPAFGLALWAVLFVGLIDNFLSPLLTSRGIKIHNFLVMLSVLGGLAFFGPIGFLAGPLVLSLFFALLDIYPTLLLHEHAHERNLLES